ncbi:MAG: hypothetical protein C0483_23405 [Pirellula sp.]|nr:hypothetical protein [Pirellula sp.]
MLLFTDIFLRGTFFFLRSAPAAPCRDVREQVHFAHFAWSSDRRAAPFAANVAGRRARNRRKSLECPPPRAHYVPAVVRGLVGKRSDAHFEGSVVRNLPI